MLRSVIITDADRFSEIIHNDTISYQPFSDERIFLILSITFAGIQDLSEALQATFRINVRIHYDTYRFVLAGVRKIQL